MSESIQSPHDSVLDAIDVISYRKNRPNIARIYRHLVRFNNISSATCEKLLDELVEQGRVIKVTYKGNISYRNAAKWKHVNRYNKKKDPNKKSASERRSSSILSGTIAELVVRVPAYFRTGVPCKVLEDHLLAKDGRFTKESIHKLLQKELQQETLVQLDNGNYFLALNNSTSNSTASEDSDSNTMKEISEKGDKDNENNKDDMDIDDLIEEINDDDDDDDDDDDEEGNEEEEDCNDDEDYDDEELDEEEEDNEEYKSRLANKGINESRTVELSGESDEEAGAIESIGQKDKDYLPPRSVSISTRRNSSGRISVRNKKTRYDASEYVFPSLKRTYKARQEKNVCSKQQPKKHIKILSSKEFKKTLLDPVPSHGGNSLANPSIASKSLSAALQKSRLPDIPLKAVQFGTSDFLCTICNDPTLLVTKASGVRCQICHRKAHSGCAENEQTKGKLKVDTCAWTCENCRYMIAQPCCVCHQTPKMEPLVICGSCKLPYHRSCHKPPLPKEHTFIGSWRCNNCSLHNLGEDCGVKKVDHKLVLGLSGMSKIGTITAQRITEQDTNMQEGRFEEVLIDEAKEKIIITSKTAFPHLREKQVSLVQINDSIATRPQQQSLASPSPTLTSSPPSSQLTGEDTIKEESDEGQHPTKILKEEELADIPDSSSWTAADVYKYFKDIFGEAIANAFLKQEIDGNSLKLLRRSDVLRGLGFKLGIGLNVLYHVKMLQFRTSDLKIIWSAE